MTKQMKDLCIKADQGSSLSECLNKYTKPQIRKILDSYGIKVASAAKKQEMADAAEAAVKENMTAYFESSEGREERDLVNALMEKPLRLENPENLEKIEDLYNKGIIFLREEADMAETVVPSDISDLLGSLKAERAESAPEKSVPASAAVRATKEAEKNRSEKEAEIIRFAGALANIYGVFTMLQLKDVWDYNHQRGIAPAELQAAVEKAGDEDGFYLEHGLLINVILGSEEAYGQIISRYGIGDTYYYPSFDVVDAYDGSLCMDDSPEYVYLRSYIERKCGEEKAGKIMTSLHLMAMRDVTPNELVDGLKEEGIEFGDLEELNLFFSLYTAWFYGLRVWVCKGYKPSELKEEKLAQRNFRLPAGEGRRVKKIGRNDPCPCGSGRKYKNCCMKKIG